SFGSLEEIRSAAGAFDLGALQASVTEHEYRETVARIKELIAAGDTYQVNFTFRLAASFEGDPWALFLQLMKHQPGNHAAFLDLGDWAICSASPELFFTREGEDFTARPMKGTRARGPWSRPDDACADELRGAEKDRAENLMIVDMMRNDLGRIARPGTVSVPGLWEIERYPTLWQMTSTVTAQSDQPTPSALAALFPCASITGAPKARTMEIIRDLECSPRRMYSGAIGHWTPEEPGRSHRARFSVAIRTALIDKSAGEVEYGVGSGIVWDSEDSSEYQECLLKAEILRRESRSFDLLETLLWEPDEGYFLLPAHLRRLQSASDYFGYGVDLKRVERALSQLAGRAGPLAKLGTPARVRLLVDSLGKPTVEFTSWPGVGSGAQPLRCCFHDVPVETDDPFLFHKTTHRDVYEGARAAHPDVDEVLLWNRSGEVCEGCIANVVVEWEGERVTPPVECGLLAGTFRGWLLERGDVRERIVTKDMLRAAERFYLVNSVRRWQSAVLVDSD
ncbi:MAG: aminodeoxychorismate synthase component I, partial [Acidobacteriota bacterium]